MRAPCPAAQLLDTIHGFDVPIVGRGRSLLERAGDGVTFGGSERPREASASDIRSPMPTAPVRGIPAGASIRRRACWLAGALGPTTLGWIRRREAAGDPFTMSASARDRGAHRKGAPANPAPRVGSPSRGTSHAPGADGQSPLCRRNRSKVGHRRMTTTNPQRPAAPPRQPKPTTARAKPTEQASLF